MALCSRCQRDAAVAFVRRDVESTEPDASRAFCAVCWESEGKQLAPFVPSPPWTLEVHDAAFSGMTAGHVEFYLALEEVATETDLAALAEGLQLRARETGRPLPAALEGFVRRHARPDQPDDG